MLRQPFTLVCVQGYKFNSRNQVTIADSALIKTLVREIFKLVRSLNNAPANDPSNCKHDIAKMVLFNQPEFGGPITTMDQAANMVIAFLSSDVGAIDMLRCVARDGSAEQQTCCIAIASAHLSKHPAR